MRALRHEINLQAFCAALMHDRSKEQMLNNFEFKERVFINITDLVTLAMYVGLSPAVREVFNAHSRGEKKDMTPMRHYLKTLSLIHHDVSLQMKVSKLELFFVGCMSITSCFVVSLVTQLGCLLLRSDQAVSNAAK